MDEMENKMRAAKPKEIVSWIHQQRSHHNSRLFAAFQTHYGDDVFQLRSHGQEYLHQELKGRLNFFHKGFLSEKRVWTSYHQGNKGQPKMFIESCLPKI